MNQVGRYSGGMGKLLTYCGQFKFQSEYAIQCPPLNKEGLSTDKLPSPNG